MCEACAPPDGWTRRHLLTAGAAASVALLAPRSRGASAQGAEILPRAAWAGDDRPPGPIAPEPDVQVLVVHHTVNANTYAADDVVALLRDIHRFHTGPDKGWPDVAYNFFVDRFGRVWEGRAGSLDGAVAGDATGGNQGFDQKCAFLGDHRTEPPTAEAGTAMAGLLALLAERHGIDSRSGATSTFTSRGSNRYPVGSTITAPTITGHRTMSQTACPGDAGMALVTEVLPGAVTAARAAASTTTPPATPTSVPPATVPPAPTTAPTGQVAPPTTPGASTLDQDPVPWPAGAAAAAVLVTGALAVRARRLRR